MRWHLTLSAPRTWRNLAPNSSFQPGVDAFGHGAEIVDHVVEVGHVDELQALDLAAPFGLAFVVGAKVALDNGGVAERQALVVDRCGVVGGVHEIVEIRRRWRSSWSSREWPAGPAPWRLGNEGFDPITSSVVTTRPNVSVIGSLSSPPAVMAFAERLGSSGPIAEAGIRHLSRRRRKRTGDIEHHGNQLDRASIRTGSPRFNARAARPNGLTVLTFARLSPARIGRTPWSTAVFEINLPV
jgi:hypothetical protein